jgi:geranylgeranyl diphosphate synthase type I
VIQTSTSIFPAPDDVRIRTDAAIEGYFDARLREVAQLAPSSAELVEAVRELTMRGGKRLRPALLVAAYGAVKPEGDVAAADSLCASIEILQSYLLIHDDWMDQDDERRGGPSVHVAFSNARGDRHLGAGLAILAGDLASAFSLELLLDAPFPPARRAEAYRAYVEMHKEVILGQHLDLVGDPNVERMHDLKTGSYTVRGPLRLGALLGDANADQLGALDRFAAPIGESFQLADDLLGTFGDPEKTGKPGDDLRHGKRTSLVIAAERRYDEATRAPLVRVLGKKDASDDDVGVARRWLEESGIRAEVKAKLEMLVSDADAVFESAPFHADGAAALRALARKLARRSS